MSPQDRDISSASRSEARADTEIQPMLVDLLRTAISHHEAGQLQQALTLYKQIITAHPNCADALHLMGVAALQVGEPHDAIKYIGLAIQNDPSVPDSYYNRGLALIAVGDLAEATLHFQKAVELEPNHAEAHNNLGNSLKEQGQLKEAEHHYRKAIDVRPDYTAAHNNLGTTLFALGRTEEAIACYRKAIEVEPVDPEAYYNLANVLRTAKRYAEAKTAYQAALKLNPRFVDAYISLGLTFRESGQPAAAVDAYKAALEVEPQAAEIYNNLAAALYEHGQVRGAEAAFREALRLRPDYADAYRNLGLLLFDRGRTNEAASAYRQSLQFEPDSAQTLYRLTLCDTYESLDQEDAVTVTKLLGMPNLQDEDAMFLHFALGKLCDDSGAYDEAFDHYEKANSIKRRKSVWNMRNFGNFIDRIIQTFEPSLLKKGNLFGSFSETPIFIVGLPRSGKSLVESIIARHSRADGIGELSNMPHLAVSLRQRIKGSDPYPECAKSIDKDMARSLAEEYLSQAMHDVTKDVLRIADSTPSNFYYLGLIALLFPRARIIHCVRDKMDTCLFMFFKHFAMEEFAYTYDLTELSTCYLEYERLAAYWREVLPLDIHEMHYEELVSNGEAEAKTLINFLGLPWEDQCLLSLRTVHSNEVRHWRNYEKYLEPLKQCFGIASTT